jgi:peptide/nickel transport system permease protein
VRYLFRRIVFYAIAAWAALSINFLIPRLMPGNPVALLLAKMRGQLSTRATHALMLQFGVSTHQTIWQEYLGYWPQVLRGNLGVSITYFPTPVRTVIAQALPWTAALVGISLLVSFVVGTLLGVIVAWRRGSWLDGLLPFTTFFSAVPYFWLALITLSVFGATLHWFPLSGGYSSNVQIGLNGPFLVSAIEHGFLPATTIVVSSIAGWILGMRNMMVTTMSEDYVLAAEAKGLSTWRVMVVYAGRNAILPSIANFALSLGFIVSGALLTELVFSYPGLGFVLFQAVSNEDFPLMQGIFLILTLAVLLANFIADFCYALLDPRTRQAVG